MQPLRIVIIALLLLAALDAHAQREANVWYFGDGAGIDFNGPTPVSLADGSLRQKEGSASIADPLTGALLFYTDGVTVWNRDHRPMPNGTRLMGHDDATQSALIVPAPCEPERFYIFTADASPLMDPPNNGIHYSMVDMEADAGRGDVVVKNVQVYAPATEKLTAVRHANGVDYWVITHEWGSNLFRVYLVSSAGVAQSPVLSYVGSAHDGSAEYGIGYLKASPDGRRIASVVTTTFVELFDFNASNGLISDPRRLTGRSKYGLSFSPNSELLYVVERQIGWSYDTLVQFDVTLPDAAAIIASRTPIDGGDLYAMQIAPDGRIYIANNSWYISENRGWLATIDRPNQRGVACGFNRRGFQFDPSVPAPVVKEGLPNHIESFLEGLVHACGPPMARIALDDPTCVGLCVPMRDSSRNAPTKWQWTFEGGRPWSSNERNPASICYDSAGVFRVTLVASNAAGSDTTFRTITVRPTSSVSVRAGTSSVAPGDTATIPVTIGDVSSEPPIGDLTVRLGYDRSTMRPIGFDVGGALLNGWTLALDDDTASATLAVHAVAPPGAKLSGAGRLLSIRFATWLSSVTSATLPVTLLIPSSICSNVPGRPGELELDLCGLQTRMIEPATTSLLLRPLQPNPVIASTRVTFVTPGTGRVRVHIHDAAGNVRARLVDEILAAGEHEVLFDASLLPSGVYHCRVTYADDVVSASLLVTH